MPYDSESDDSSVEISDVDVSEDETSTIPSDDERQDFGFEKDKVRSRVVRASRHDDEDDDDGGGDDSALVQLKEEKFFERLGHFMKVQRDQSC
jgi:hypothetical protein